MCSESRRAAEPQSRRTNTQDGTTRTDRSNSNSTTTSLFGSLALSFTLLALSNSATKVLSKETTDFISNNIIPVFGVYVVVVFIIRTTAVACSGSEPGFLILEKSITTRNDLDSRAS